MALRASTSLLALPVRLTSTLSPTCPDARSSGSISSWIFAITSLSAKTYLWIALLALIPQLVGHSTYNWALRYLPAAVVAVTTLGEPIGSAMLAFIILNERPAAFVLAGAVLILAGIYLAARGAQAPAADSA